MGRLHKRQYTIVEHLWREIDNKQTTLAKAYSGAPFNEHILNGRIE
jgi:hypothetical protein